MPIATETSVNIDLRSPAFFADPYPTFARLRESHPVYWSPQWQRWVLTRYDDIIAVLRDTRRFSSNVIPRLGTPAEKVEMDPFLRAMPRWLFFLDPPVHGPARAPYAQPFTPSALAEMQPAIQRMVDELLDRVATNGWMDAIWDFAFPLPATVLAEMLCPPEDRAFLVAQARGLAWASANPLDATARQNGIGASATLADYFRELIARRNERRPGKLLEHFVRLVEERSALDEDDVVAQCLLMLCAGNETTQHATGNSLLALLQNPDQLQRLRENPDGLPNAVDELLRFDSPVQSVNRMARADVGIRGQIIRQGDEVVLLIAAANRDPERFVEPDRLDLARSDIAHLSFGYANHYCLGAALVRMEVTTALRTLLRRFPKLRLADKGVDWRTHDPALRGMRSLPIGLRTRKSP